MCGCAGGKGNAGRTGMTNVGARPLSALGGPAPKLGTPAPNPMVSNMSPKGMAALPPPQPPETNKDRARIERLRRDAIMKMRGYA